MASHRYWMSAVKEEDDFGHLIHDTFIDGATIYGQWAIMTPESHRLHGRGIGPGLGQQYEKQPDGRWLQVRGGVNPLDGYTPSNQGG